MAAPEFYDRVLEPPTPGANSDELFRWSYDLWQRTGGYINYVVNLQGLLASVQELNTLVGIDTSTTVQDQLNTKFDSDDAGTLASQNSDNVNITGGVIDDVTMSGATIETSNVSGELRAQIGNTATFLKVPASLYSDATAIGNVNAAETTLMNYTLGANNLSTNKDYLEIAAWGTFAANANNKRVRLYFGATTVFDTTSLATNAGNWVIRATIIREASADQKTIASVISSNALLTPTAQTSSPSEDLTNSILIKVTGLGVASNDVIQEGFTIQWHPAST